ncbi:hypothetical protein Cop2CBH44_16010 [Coprobacter secundus subsp. similis]|uniref:Uncharacterized protein n=1 Tax=Coprobacter secundus subsp. similis TaxID=2751153 RepID=A0A7G1HYF9_9BACT|nr:hypothetical protein Cop2CBH44_16010 [Coprobacter secundus subsp. similis]
MEALLMIFTTLFSIIIHNDILPILFTNNPSKKSKYIFLQIPLSSYSNKFLNSSINLAGILLFTL